MDGQPLKFFKLIAAGDSLGFGAHVRGKNAMTPCPISAAVARDIEARARVGWHKYGTSVGASPLPTVAWVRHAYEEALDLAVYLRRVLADMEGKP